MSSLLKSVTFVVPAAGKGLRMGAEIPKQYLELAGKPILQHTLEKLLSLNPHNVVLVIAPGDESWMTIPCTKHCVIAVGGDSRADSVLNGLQMLENKPDSWVLVHDCVRPCVRVADIETLYLSLEKDAVGGLLAVPVTDTLKHVRTDVQVEVLNTEPREQYWLAQTPQMFRFGLLQNALKQSVSDGFEITDEASAVEMMGYKPILVKSSKDNIKITTQEDIRLAEYFLAEQGASS